MGRILYVNYTIPQKGVLAVSWVQRINKVRDSEKLHNKNVRIASILFSTQRAVRKIRIKIIRRNSEDKNPFLCRFSQIAGPGRNLRRIDPER